MIVNLVEIAPLLSTHDHNINFLRNIIVNLVEIRVVFLVATKNSFYFERIIIVNLVEIVPLLGRKDHKISILGNKQKIFLVSTYYYCKLGKNGSLLGVKNHEIFFLGSNQEIILF